jgi:hypothetical protein
MPVTIKDYYVYKPLNLVVSSELGTLLLARFTRERGRDEEAENI